LFPYPTLFRAVVDLDEVAVPAVAPGELHRAIGHGVDRRAVAGLEVEPGVHPAVAEDRVAAHAVARSDPARNRRQQARALLAHARGLEETPVAAPAHQLLARLSAAQQPGVKQLAGLDLAGGGALVLDDQVEFVACTDRPVEIDLTPDRAQILLHRAGRSAGGT